MLEGKGGDWDEHIERKVTQKFLSGLLFVSDSLLTGLTKRRNLLKGYLQSTIKLRNSYLSEEKEPGHVSSPQEVLEPRSQLSPGLFPALVFAALWLLHFCFLLTSLHMAGDISASSSCASFLCPYYWRGTHLFSSSGKTLSFPTQTLSPTNYLNNSGLRVKVMAVPSLAREGRPVGGRKKRDSRAHGNKKGGTQRKLDAHCAVGKSVPQSDVSDRPSCGRHQLLHKAILHFIP